MAKAMNGDGNSKSRGGGSGARQRRPQRWRPKEQRQCVEIDRDLSQKRVGPLALARLYGESCIFTVNNPSPLNWPKRKQICDASLLHYWMYLGTYIGTYLPTSIPLELSDTFQLIPWKVSLFRYPPVCLSAWLIWLSLHFLGKVTAHKIKFES